MVAFAIAFFFLPYGERKMPLALWA